MSQPNRFILSLESAIAGGSIALFRDLELLASRCGDGTISRLEDLLPSIMSMLAEAGVSKEALSRVAVSLGPGSYTGLRIGIATAMGLKRGLGIEYVGVPVFRAISAGLSCGTIAVPMGRSDVCYADTGSPETLSVTSVDEFLQGLAERSTDRIFIHPALESKIAAISNVKWELLKPNLAEYIGHAATELPASESLEPIYAQNPRFR